MITWDLELATPQYPIYYSTHSFAISIRVPIHHLTLTGDMDFFQVDLGCPHQGNADPNPACHLCRTNKSTMNWFDFRRRAPWRSTLPRDPASAHPINGVIGWSPWHFAIDWLHIVDLGIAAIPCPGSPWSELLLSRNW